MTKLVKHTEADKGNESEDRTGGSTATFVSRRDADRFSAASDA